MSNNTFRKEWLRFRAAMVLVGSAATLPLLCGIASAADADTGALSSSGGTFGRGTMTVNLGALAVGDQGSVCFRTAIR